MLTTIPTTSTLLVGIDAGPGAFAADMANGPLDEDCSPVSTYLIIAEHDRFTKAAAHVPLSVSVTLTTCLIVVVET
jgi:hypothetical protein